MNGASQHEFMPMIWRNGGEIAVQTDQGWKATIDSPEAREALQAFADLYLKHKVSQEGRLLGMCFRAVKLLKPVRRR